MKCGKTDLCELQEIKGKYSVTWNKHISGLSVYSDKAIILLDMILKDSKSNEVGILLSNGHVLWLSFSAIKTMSLQALADYLVRCGSLSSPYDIKGAVFDNLDDVETFADRLEKKYIIHVLKE